MANESTNHASRGVDALRKMTAPIKVALSLLLAVTLALSPLPLIGTERAYAETGTSGLISEAVCKIARYVDGVYTSDIKENVLTVNGDAAYCMNADIKFKSGTVTSADILSIVTQEQLVEIALARMYVCDVYDSAYVSDYARIMVAQTMIWEILHAGRQFSVVPSEQGGGFAELTESVRNDMTTKARAFIEENADRYRAYGTLWLNGDTQPLATVGCEPLMSNDLFPIVKHDAETKWPSAASGALGGATLSGARYRVSYYENLFGSVAAAESSGAPDRIWEFKTGSDGRIDFANAETYLVSGELFRDASGKVAYPIGTYTIKEVDPSEGYLISDGSYLVKVEKSGNGTKVSGDAKSSGGSTAIPDAEQVKRGDLALTKVRESDMARLASVPFRLTSETTGESHVLVTDENGRIDTSSSWNAHTKATNANDAAVDEDGNVDEPRLDADAGVWFGKRNDDSMTSANDSLGALPFDTYTLEELRCSANEGLTLVKITGLVCKRDGYMIDLGTIDDRSDSAPYISTQAFDAFDLDKWVIADAAASIVDHVEYMNLTPNESYELRATLIDPLTDAPVEGAHGSAEFVARSANGAIDVPIDVDLSRTSLQKVVVFEELLCKGVVVADHKDSSDSSQTVNVGIPNVTTYARDAHDGDKQVAAQSRAVVTDEIELVNLMPGRTYQVYGTVINTVTGLPVMSKASNGDDNAAVVGEELSSGLGATDEADIASITREPSESEIQGFWYGLMDVLGASKDVSSTHHSYSIEPGSAFDAEAVRAYMDDNSDLASRMVLSQMQVEAKDAKTVASLDYEMDATDMDGDYVIFDLLTSDGQVMAVHADASNEAETFAVEQPRISTEATDATDGDHVLLPSMDAKVIDSVSYSGLMAGHEYTLNGVIVNKSDGSMLYVGDKSVEAEAKFTPNASSGSVQLEFKFDSSGLAEGTELVVYEFLTKDGEDVAEHADLSDEAQTISIGSVPTGRGYYKTGGADDGTPLMLAIGTALGAGLFASAQRRKGAHRA